MAVYVFVPPLGKTAGGVTVLFQVASHLARAGVETVLAARGELPRGGTACRDLAVVELSEARPASEDFWVVPEGWVNALAPGLRGGARCVVYVQNWAYLFSSLPEGVDWSSLDVSFISVSEPVRRFVAQATGRDSLVLRPGIDRGLFAAPETKPGVADGVRVAWMPRKNKSLGGQVMRFLAGRRAWAGKASVAFTPIENLDAAGVARVLAESHVFLATGYPEGCPLPPLEAMASGCLVAGYPGFGGFDYMRSAAGPEAAPWAARPWFGEREVAWGGNGLFAADADVLGLGLALETAVDWWEAGARELDAAQENARLTAEAYDIELQAGNVARVFGELGAL